MTTTGARDTSPPAHEVLDRTRELVTPAVRTAVETLPEDMRRRLLDLPTAGLSAQLRQRGLNQVSIEGVAPSQPGTKLVGVAKTLRFVPAREDLFKKHGGGYNAQKQA